MSQDKDIFPVVSITLSRRQEMILIFVSRVGTYQYIYEGDMVMTHTKTLHHKL